MPIIIAFSIVAVSVSAILYKTYVGYGDYNWYTKLGFFLFTVVSLAAPFICYGLRNSTTWSFLIHYNKILYFLFGFIFFLFVITLLRDIFWVVADVIRHVPLEEMKNPTHLQTANLITIAACLFICLYGVYEAEKNAAIINYDITSLKIKKETKVVMLADLHIDRDVPVKYVDNLVNRVNSLDADAVVLVGDIIDNSPNNLTEQMQALKELKAKEGVYVVLGNHEFYAGGILWGIAFEKMGFKFLNNYGSHLADTGIYIAGIPDINTSSWAKMPVNLGNALYYANPEDYVIMLSHTPKIVEGMTKDNVDLELSGHTHGGQIYPFHYLAKKSNDGHLAGFYDEQGIKMYVSRGTRYWGPPMRIFAPSEITVFNFKPEKTNE